MKYKLLDHKDEIITHLIKNLIWTPIAAILPMSIALVKSIFDTVKSQENKFFTSTNILIVLSILLLIGLFFFLKMSIEETKEKALSSKFRAELMDAELTFDTREKITSKLTYNMTALVNNITEIERLITWTGSKYIKTSIEDTNGDYSLVDSNRKISPHPIKISFNPEKNSGDFVKFTTVTSVEDGDKEMSPHYSFMVKYQIDKLVLHVVAPRGLIKNVKKAVYADTGREIIVEKPSSIRSENVGNLVRYTYEIENPTFLYNYFIEWEFTN